MAYKRILRELWKKILAHVQPYIEDLKTSLTINTFLPLQEVLQWPNRQKREFKRNAVKMPFVITCRAFKGLFQEKENKTKEEIAKLERKMEREK